MPGAPVPGAPPGLPAGGRGAPGTPPGRGCAVRGWLTPKGLLPIRGGRGAPGIPPVGRAGRGAGGCPSGRVAGAGAPSRAAGATGVSWAGRAGATGDAPLVTARVLGADWKPGPADPVTGGVEVVGAGAVADAAGATLLGGAAGVCAGRAAAGAGAAAAGCAGGGAAAAGRAAGAGPAAAAVGRGAGAPGRPGPPAGAVLVAADPLVGRSAFVAGLLAGKASRNLRTTGASMVEDGDLTNSPMSVSFAMISLLVLPSSFASSCTRALPATALLRVRAAAGGNCPLAR